MKDSTKTLKKKPSSSPIIKRADLPEYYLQWDCLLTDLSGRDRVAVAFISQGKLHTLEWEGGVKVEEDEIKKLAKVNKNKAIFIASAIQNLQRVYGFTQK